jgi:Fur family transcriptional regulator, ferric uptake regulator
MVRPVALARYDENDLSLSYHPPPGGNGTRKMAPERATRQRDAIKSVMQGAKRPLSPLEVLQAARAEVRKLGMATVYRNLKRLVAEGIVQVIRLPGENPRYEMGKSPHHHHFQCTSCRRVYDIPGCPGSLSRLAPRGFRVEHHDVTLYGRCSDCGKPEARAPR